MVLVAHSENAAYFLCVQNFDGPECHCRAQERPFYHGGTEVGRPVRTKSRVVPQYAYRLTRNDNF